MFQMKFLIFRLHINSNLKSGKDYIWNIFCILFEASSWKNVKKFSLPQVSNVMNDNLCLTICCN